jgi:hypothetical protein
MSPWNGTGGSLRFGGMKEGMFSWLCKQPAE